MGKYCGKLVMTEQEIIDILKSLGHRFISHNGGIIKSLYGRNCVGYWEVVNGELVNIDLKEV